MLLQSTFSLTISPAKGGNLKCPQKHLHSPMALTGCRAIYCSPMIRKAGELFAANQRLAWRALRPAPPDVTRPLRTGQVHRSAKITPDAFGIGRGTSGSKCCEIHNPFQGETWRATARTGLESSAGVTRRCEGRARPCCHTRKLGCSRPWREGCTVAKKVSANRFDEPDRLKAVGATGTR